MTDATDFLEKPFIMGIIFLVAGAIMYLFPPKNINSFYGYRTSKSMKNQETWTFAQKYSSVKAIQSSIFLLLISCLGFFITFESTTQNIIVFVALAIVIFFMFFSTEKAIKTKFPNL
ncbi:MAG: SdpI family protein [Flavobacterium sp.]|nr:SdpI family protein [Flavobacterium sp.]